MEFSFLFFKGSPIWSCWSQWCRIVPFAFVWMSVSQSKGRILSMHTINPIIFSLRLTVGWHYPELSALTPYTWLQFTFPWRISVAWKLPGCLQVSSLYKGEVWRGKLQSRNSREGREGAGGTAGNKMRLQDHSVLFRHACTWTLIFPHLFTIMIHLHETRSSWSQVSRYSEKSWLCAPTLMRQHSYKVCLEHAQTRGWGGRLSRRKK